MPYEPALFDEIGPQTWSNSHYNEEQGDTCYARMLGTYINNERQVYIIHLHVYTYFNCRQLFDNIIIINYVTIFDRGKLPPRCDGGKNIIRIVSLVEVSTDDLTLYLKS